MHIKPSQKILSRRQKTPALRPGMDAGRDSAPKKTLGFSPGGAPFVVTLALIFSAFCVISSQLSAEQPVENKPIQQDILAHYYRGKELDKQGKHAEAIVELKKALEIDPNFGKAHLMLGVEYTVQNRHEEAIGEYRTAIGLRMDNVNMAIAHYNLGSEYRHKGMLKEAQREFKESLRLDPNFSYPRRALRQMNTPFFFKFIGQRNAGNIFMIFLIPFVIFLVFGIQFLRHARLKRALENLKNYFHGNIIGGKLSSPEFEGLFQGKKFSINFRDRGRSEGVILEIRISAGIGFNLEIKGENVLTKAGEKMGLVHEVKINVPQFDNKYLITSPESVRAMSYLQNPGARRGIDNLFAKGFQSFTAEAGLIKIHKTRYSLENDLSVGNLTEILQNLVIASGQEVSWHTDKPFAADSFPSAGPSFKKGFFFSRIVFIGLSFYASLLVISSVLTLASAFYEPPGWLRAMVVYFYNQEHTHYTWAQIKALRQESVWNVMPTVVMQLVMAALLEAIFVFGIIKERKFKTMPQSSKFNHP
jgi:hypothetical protein